MEVSKIVFDLLKDGSTEIQTNERTSLIFGEKKKIPTGKKIKVNYLETMLL